MKSQKLKVKNLSLLGNWEQGTEKKYFCKDEIHPRRKTEVGVNFEKKGTIYVGAIMFAFSVVADMNGEHSVGNCPYRITS